MPAVSQVALELIGRRRYLGAQKLAGGYTNRVWRVFCEDGATYIVKSYRAPWTRANEQNAIAVLGPHRLAPAHYYARSAKVLIWPDDGLVPMKRWRDEDLRAVGYALRAIHELPAPQARTSEKPGWRTVNRIAARGLSGSGFAPDFANCVHGDPCLENVLSAGNGRFARFNDFEEFGPGDVRADLIVCLLEAACSVPERCEDVVARLVEGYCMAEPLPADLYRPITETEVRRSLAQAALNELAGWAAQNKEVDLVARYRNAGPGAVDAIAALRFQI